MEREYEDLSLTTFKQLVREIKEHTTLKEQNELRILIKKSLKAQIFNDKDITIALATTTINTLFILMREMGLKGNSIIPIILLTPHKKNIISLVEIEQKFDAETAKVVKGLIKIEGITSSYESIVSDNYINLLITLAEDIRVILIRVARALYLLRNIEKHDNKVQLHLTRKVKHVYAPLAHKLGLYKIKLEMDDRCLLHADKDTYNFIVNKLKDSEEVRDKFISDFIAPIQEKLKGTDLKYDIKGRVKSISSIENKLRKQKIEFESIYDIFAIRLILDSPLDKEKADCWQAYSIVSDLYTPNPKRLKDWLSIPKSNGYESLHTTVMGPEHKWVEVQVRSRRMDEIAERGLAAHWKYKGVKSQSRLDDWLTNLREVLENKNIEDADKINDFKLDLYEEEIYVFTPKGDLQKLPAGATILDFAFSVHSKIGCSCVSGKVNGRNVPIKYKLNNGDQVEIITSNNQKPKQDWLNFVHTSKAKNRIRQSLKEEANKQVELAKELLKRRFKNRKIDFNESILMKTVKKYGFKHLTDFYVQIAEEKIDVNNFLDLYLQIDKKETENHETFTVISAGNYVAPIIEEDVISTKDELILDKNLTGIHYSLAKCCAPIFGDDVFGFVSTKGIKIHRKTCPNAQDMLERFPYRVHPARWSGVSNSNYSVVLRIVGTDDIGIMNNITSVISKDSNVSIRSISVDSDDGVFDGHITVKLNDKDKLNQLIKKLQGVKGVKTVQRRN